MITLTHSTAHADINPEGGAWVETLTRDGQAVLFPKTDLMSDSGERKTRGGMHVCLPNFGPGGTSALAQHGFGRTLPWEVVHHNVHSVTLRLQGSGSLYSSLISTLVYTLEPSQFKAELTVKNTGQTSLRVAPGFHPYFALSESEAAVSVNDVVYELDKLGGTEFITAENVALQTSEQRLSLEQSNLSTWAVWTDQLANYVCVEPTYGGYRFLEPSSPEEHLVPGAEKTFSCSIGW